MASLAGCQGPGDSDGTPTSTDTPEPAAETDYGGWFDDTDNFDGTADMRGESSVTDDRFYTGEALYLANQDIWVGNWGGDFYQGRGIPGQRDEPPES